MERIMKVVYLDGIRNKKIFMATKIKIFMATEISYRSGEVPYFILKYGEERSQSIDADSLIGIYADLTK